MAAWVRAGESSEEWRSTYSVEYVLHAIQSLIMNSQPFHNEPGYETIDGTNGTQEDVDNYRYLPPWYPIESRQVLTLCDCDAYISIA